MIDRTKPPWNAAPSDCTDFDEATWYHLRHHSELAGHDPMPRQSLEEWVRRMRASRELDEVRYQIDVAREIGALL